MVSQRYGAPLYQFQAGTKASGGQKGTVSFKYPFSGTPTVLTSVLGGSSSFGRVRGVHVQNIFSGSFTWGGGLGLGATGSGGTLSWMAMRVMDRWPRKP